VNVGQHHAVSLEDAVLLTITHLLGDLLLDAAKLGVAARQRILEATQLLVDLVGENPALLHLDAPAEEVRHPHGDTR
jgi:hypothetical protein